MANFCKVNKFSDLRFPPSINQSERCRLTRFFPVDELWDTLKFEIWKGSSEDWIQSSLDPLRGMTASLDKPHTIFDD